MNEVSKQADARQSAGLESGTRVLADGAHHAREVAAGDLKHADVDERAPREQDEGIARPWAAGS